MRYVVMPNFVGIGQGLTSVISFFKRLLNPQLAAIFSVIVFYSVTYFGPTPDCKTNRVVGIILAM